MMYMFVNPKTAKRLEEDFKIKISQRDDVLVVKEIKSKWECEECDKEYSNYHPRRCSCGSFKFKTL